MRCVHGAMTVILVVVGTRPEVIKMAPVLAALQRQSKCVRPILCSTGQHRELVEQALGIFDLRPDVSLDVMQPNQSLSSETSGRRTKIPRERKSKRMNSSH